MSEPSSLRERKKEATRTSIARAALALFATKGFEQVTLAEVADAAEVGQRTLFRYYADKEELLFGEDEAVDQLLRAAVAARPRSESVAESAIAATWSLVPLWQARQEEGRARQAVIEASPALLARERAKQRLHENALAESLAQRGADPSSARLVSRVAVACFDEAVRRWLLDTDPARPGLASRVRRTTAALVTHLGAVSPGDIRA